MRTVTFEERVFPFPAIIGQDDLKLSLILNAINPRIGGVLIRGEKGTAKSTAVRSLALLLPETEVVEGCLFYLRLKEIEEECRSCGLCSTKGVTLNRRVPVITLPLNSTEDRVCGGIDFKKTTLSGERKIQPGLLARAHHGILYVDEVNLLDDHLVDVILAAAAEGRNRIEREGVSFSHPSEFILVGTMNPEEGDLRPQLLDRFGLCVEVTAESDRKLRVRTMEQRELFDSDPAAFRRAYEAEEREIAKKIRSAGSLLPRIYMPSRLRALISELCTEALVAGHRADLIIEQAARALAAFSEKFEVEEDDVIRVAPFALRHRRRDPSPPPPPEDKQHDHSHDDNHSDEDDDNKDEQEENHNDPQNEQDEQQQGQQPPESGEKEEQDSSSGSGGAPDDSSEPDHPVNPDAVEKVFDVGETFKVKPFSSRKDRVFRRGSGRRSRSRISGLQGRYVKSTMSRGSDDIALDATLRAAAPFQRSRTGDCAISIRPEDIREKIRERRIGNFLLFVVDASGSMGARGRMAATKGAVMSLLIDAYQKRDKVALISFNKSEARLNLPPTSSIDMAARMLAEMPVGGRTPLNAALIRTDEVVRGQLVRDPTSRPIVVIITDGRSNVSIGGGKPFEESLELAGRLKREERVSFILVDTEEQGLIRFGLAAKIAQALNARYLKTSDLKAETLLNLINEK